MNYYESQRYLRYIQDKSAKLALNNIKKIVDNLPFNIDKIKFLQVAGTNGKGSTSHFITSILQYAGYKVGLFTSPHLQNIRERITINKDWISKKDFSDSLTDIKKICEELLEKKLINNIPTFFEYLFLCSIYYFYNKKVDFVVLEVGLGGRLDATSTITPEVSIITNISFDHTKTLGKKIKDIAYEKAGIIKQETPIICGCKKHSSSKKVIEMIAHNKNAPFFSILDAKNRLETNENNNHYKCVYSTPIDKYNFEVHLNGEHQIRNALIAIKSIELLNKKGYNIEKESVFKGIKMNFVPGRIEIINRSPQIILDIGHNLEGIKALKKFLEQKKFKNLTLIFGVLRDKNYKKMVPLLLPFIKNVIITEPISKRALEAEKLIELFERKNVLVEKNIKKILKLANQFNEKILITGSSYLAGEIRNIIFGRQMKWIYPNLKR